MSKLLSRSYGVVEILFGAFIAAGVGPFASSLITLPAGMTIIDGFRRLVDKGQPKTLNEHVLDVVTSAGTIVMGGIGIVGGLVFAVLGEVSTSLAARASILSPAFLGVGVVLTIGGLSSTVSRVKSFFRERVLINEVKGAMSAAGVVLDTAPAPVASKEVAPAFTVASEVKADNAPVVEKPAAPVPPAPPAAT